MTLILGYPGSLFYSKTKIPDLIWLFIFGILLGPVFHLYNPEPFLEVSSLLTTVALSIIVFEAGINIDIKQTVYALPKSIALLVFTFSLSVISIGCFVYFFIPQDFTLFQGLVLGTMVGGTSTVSIAVIGDKSFITAFEFMGAYGFLAEEEGEVKTVLRRLLNEDEKFKIIIISERFAKATLEMRLKVVETGRIYPLFAILPDIKGRVKGERVKELKSFISRAIGVELR